MRFVHTADWHIGRLFHNVSLLRDQEHVLADLIRLLKDLKPDALVVAGDVYDRSVPAADAVRLLDNTLSEIVLGLGIPTLMIAGNHDDGDRLGFGSAMLQARGLHVRGKYTSSIEPVTLEDKHGAVDFALLPYGQGVPLEARTTGGLAEIKSYDAAMVDACQKALAGCSASRRVGVAHCFAAGGGGSDSERPLSVGGSDQINPSAFDEFNYVALGHLHKPQKVGKNAAYSGSLLKYSFSEAAHTKSVSVVELAADGSFVRTEEQLDTARDVRIVEDDLESLLASAEGPGTDDYILARLTDAGAVYDALARLRSVYPNILAIERPGLFASASPGVDRSVAERAQELSALELMEKFFEDITGEELTDAQRKHATAALEVADLDKGSTS